MSQTQAIADVQNSKDTRQIPINKVGIKDIRHPVRVEDRSEGEQHTIANFNMYVNLPHNFKGTHMSRFVEILNNHEREISVKSFKDMMTEMAERLEADSGHIEMNFPYFINKAAPVSGVQSLMDYDVTFIGEIHNGVNHMIIKVVVPVTSLCPCSKKISDYGAHNQRSHVTITAKVKDFVWIEEIIELVESEASCGKTHVGRMTMNIPSSLLIRGCGKSWRPSGAMYRFPRSAARAAASTLGSWRNSRL